MINKLGGHIFFTYQLKKGAPVNHRNAKLKTTNQLDKLSS